MTFCVLCLSLWTFDAPGQPRKVCVAREIVAGHRGRCLLWMETK